MIHTRDTKTLPLLDTTDSPITPPGGWGIISGDGKYRYLLGRRLAPTGNTALWIMVNPSIADAKLDDPTVRRCINFTRAWGYAALEVVNLFAYRSTDPQKLKSLSIDECEGPENAYYIQEAAMRAALIVCAWGTHAITRKKDAMGYLRAILPAETHYHCLHILPSGAPQHPLMLKSGLQPIPYTPLANPSK